MIEYFTGLCLKYSDDLLSNGMTEDDINSISSDYATLVAADAAHKNARKLWNVASQTRDEALAALKEEVFKVRKFLGISSTA